MPPRGPEIDRLIIEELLKDPTISEEDLGLAIDVARNTVSTHLRKMIANGRLLPKGHYLKNPRHKIIKYIFVTQPEDVPGRRKLGTILESHAHVFPYVRVTYPFDYIVFIPEGTPGAETDEFTTQLLDTGSTTKTSVLTGEPPEGSPELPERRPANIGRRQRKRR